MVNTFGISIIYLVQRLAIALTLCSLAYVIFFFLSNQHNTTTMDDSSLPSVINIPLSSPSTIFNIQPFDEAENAKARDIFSLTQNNISVPTEDTPKGQLPDHLKVVGILVADPSQIVIEDTNSKTTYFIDEKHPQDGINVVNIKKDQAIVNYQGQSILIPVSKN